MVVIAAAVCTKSGKALVSRQFVEISRSRIESLLTAFPKLVANSTKQYTFVDGPGVRFVYQPMDDLYAVIVTNKASNIVEDLETLQLITNIISETCGSVNEINVSHAAFELVFAFDEVISLGNKEKLNISQVKQLLIMDSQEEKMAEIVQKNQEREAAKEAERRRKELERIRKDEAQYSRMGMGPGQFGRGMGSAPGSSMSSGMRTMGNSTQPQIETRREPQRGASPASSGPPRKGLSLGSNTPKASDYMDTLKQELGAGQDYKEIMRQQSSSANPSSSPSPTLGNIPPASMRDDVHVSISEKLMVKLDKDGNVQHFEVRGELDVFVTKEQFNQVSFKLNPKISTAGLDFKVHPNYHKPKFMQEQIICLRDASKTFAVNAPNGILKWRMVSQDSSRLPLLVNCWPSASGNGMTVVNMEYEARPSLELHDVLIKIPIVAKDQPNITGANGETNYDVKNSVLEWSLPMIDKSNSTGNLDFELAQWRSNDTAHLFPIQVQFTSTTSLCDVAVLEAANGNQPIKFSTHTVVSVESYTIE